MGLRKTDKPAESNWSGPIRVGIHESSPRSIVNRKATSSTLSISVKREIYHIRVTLNLEGVDRWTTNENVARKSLNCIIDRMRAESELVPSEAWPRPPGL